MGIRQLAVKQQAFLKHYLGADMGLHGNATQCYLLVYKCSLKAAESGGARLLQNAKVQEYITANQQIVAEKTGIDAEYVLRQSIRYLEIAIGDRPVPENFHHTGVKAALELIGKHTQVQAFRDRIEHTHTHRLEQALARKSREVEKAALERNLKLVE